MNDRDLRDRLRGWTPPFASDAARERAKYHALIAFKNRRIAVPVRHVVDFWRSLAMVAPLVLVAALIAFWPHPKSDNLAADRTMLRETEKLFPQQVNGIIEKNGQTQLSLSEVRELGGQQPVLLVFTRAHDVVRVLSYSGHHVCVPLVGGEKCFEVLATTDGGVILENQDAAVMSGHHFMVDGYSVRAQMISL